MSYQHCRWYDPYPKLAFAFKLLYLAPRHIRRKVLEDLVGFLAIHAGKTHAAATVPASANRWYDLSADVTGTLELIKQSPESLKHLSADRMLSDLARYA